MPAVSDHLARRLPAQVALALTVAAAVSASCARPLDPADCDRLLAHYTALLVREHEPTTPPERVAERVQAALALGRDDARFQTARCTESLTRRAFDCAVAAPTVDEVERCLVF